MKLGLFADPHYSSAEVTCKNRYNSRSLQKMKDACARFEREKCDLIICLGDLTDSEPTHEEELATLKLISEVLRHCSVPVAVLMGNHDAFTFTREEFYRILGEQFRPVDRSSDGKTLIFADCCYCSSGKPYMPKDTDWTDSFLPNADAFQARIDEADGDVYVFSHQNLDPTVECHHIISNAEEIRDILESSGKVKAVYQGHYHPGSETRIGGIRYVTLPALCTYENAVYTVEI